MACRRTQMLCTDNIAQATDLEDPEEDHIVEDLPIRNCIPGRTFKPTTA
jgi:hypothetical protein